MNSPQIDDWWNLNREELLAQFPPMDPVEIEHTLVPAIARWMMNTDPKIPEGCTEVYFFEAAVRLMRSISDILRMADEPKFLETVAARIEQRVTAFQDNAHVPVISITIQEVLAVVPDFLTVLAARHNTPDGTQWRCMNCRAEYALTEAACPNCAEELRERV